MNGLGGVVLKEALNEKKQETQLIFLSLYSIGSTLALELPNSRMQESEADKLGLIFMSMAGYNPEEAIPFWDLQFQVPLSVVSSEGSLAAVFF